MSLIIHFEGGWWDIIGSSPLKNLLVTILGSSLGLVETLETSIMSLIQSPVLMEWDPITIKFISDGVISLDGSL